VGASATIGVGTVTTGAAGSSVVITNSGTSTAAVLNFTVPKGDPGSSTSTGSATFDYLQVGPLDSIKSASFIGTPKVYHETRALLDQIVEYKVTTGAVPSTALGRTAQHTIIAEYQGQLASGINPVNVAASNLNTTMVVGGNPSTPAKGSAVNQQFVNQVSTTDTSAGPNEFANTVMLLEPMLGAANSGNTIWQNDWSVYGAADGPDYALYGTTQMICRWNPSAATSGQKSVGSLVTTRPQAGAGFQARSNMYTFPVDIGVGVAGFTGINNRSTLSGAYSAGATKGFEVAFQSGSNLGPWLNDGTYNGGSKIGTGFLSTDHMDYGVRVGAPHPSATAPIAIATSATAGVVSLGADAPWDPSALLSVSGKVSIQGGGFNTGHLQLGLYHLWIDTAGKIRTKSGAPTTATDGALIEGTQGPQGIQGIQGPAGSGGVTGAGSSVDSEVAVFSGTSGGALKRSYQVFKSVFAGNVNANGTASTIATGFSVSKTSLGTYLITTALPLAAENYGITATARDVNPGWVRRVLNSGNNFLVETVDGNAALADIGFGFTIIQI
jgi:hypothetical protein